MEALLNIVHGYFDRVPTHNEPMLIPDLYEICVIADKYDMVRILRPWAKGWLSYALRSAEVGTVHPLSHNYNKLLWVAWVFGDKVGFEKLAKELLLQFYPTRNGEHTLGCPEVLEPPEIYREFILKPILARYF
ncbi:putative nuclear pore protein [Rosellinia necatrix]|uniref:Putative nuclear pore protein n=1 Tax=Rosellinia necatrix TaxID=77044 RepID=A0A1S8ABF0_ROSNE|nr:putative nuclear pore protein [Rosellinia necatrix]